MIDRPECPECGSVDTIVLNGRVKLGKWCFQQRHQCRECGQKFLSWWTGELLRKYGDQGEMLEKPAYQKRKTTGQMALPGMGVVS